MPADGISRFLIHLGALRRTLSADDLERPVISKHNHIYMIDNTQQSLVSKDDRTAEFFCIQTQ